MSDEWFVGTLQGPEGAQIVRALSALPDASLRIDNSSLIIIRWAYDGDTMPDAETLEAIQTFEDAMFDSIEQDDWAIEAASLTGNGVKEWRLYTASVGAFMAGFNSALTGHSPYPLDLQTFEDPDWDAFFKRTSTGLINPGNNPRRFSPSDSPSFRRDI